MADNLPPSCADCPEIWEPNLLEPLGPVHACNGTALPFYLTVTHVIVTELTRKIKELGYKSYVDSFFSAPELVDDLATKQIYCCGTPRQNRRGMPQDLPFKANKTETGRHLMDQA
jgi:hypothetical protein